MPGEKRKAPVYFGKSYSAQEAEAKTFEFIEHLFPLSRGNELVLCCTARSSEAAKLAILHKSENLAQDQLLVQSFAYGAGLDRLHCTLSFWLEHSHPAYWTRWIGSPLSRSQRDRPYAVDERFEGEDAAMEREGALFGKGHGAFVATPPDEGISACALPARARMRCRRRGG